MTMHVFSGPISWPVLHTAIVHAGVSIFAQSIPQGSSLVVSVVVVVLAVVLVSRSGTAGPQLHPTFHTTSSKSQIRTKPRTYPSITPRSRLVAHVGPKGTCVAESSMIHAVPAGWRGPARAAARVRRLRHLRARWIRRRADPAEAGTVCYPQ